jgi:UDP-N-acetyl-alpha-D-muramoyl-L-alanyl-L-glutamate epimerase
MIATSLLIASRDYAKGVTTAPLSNFDPKAISAFQFTYRSMAPDGLVRLGYALDDIEFEETLQLPAPRFRGSPAVEGLLDLLHWVAGVSYFKAAIPRHLVCETGAPPPASERLLAALYSEGLGEFAVVNELDQLPHPQFPRGVDWGITAETRVLKSLLVPVGGGKDSAVAIEIARRSGLETSLFSIGDAPPISATAKVATLPRHVVTRTIDPRLFELNASGALNGHVPITAIVSCVALLTAATQGIDAVLMANERSASAGNFMWQGVEVNHQFSKSRHAERLLADAVAEIEGAPQIFSILRPASELSIASAFAKLEQYHPAFTSCNRVFQLDPEKRLGSWCCDCDKCRFVFLILAPFLPPAKLTEIFGKDMLDDPAQYEGFALLTATGGDKPFECVGEVEECLAAIYLIARHHEWRERANVRRLVDEVLAAHPLTEEQVGDLFWLSTDHDIPDSLIEPAREILRP